MKKFTTLFSIALVILLGACTKESIVPTEGTDTVSLTLSNEKEGSLCAAKTAKFMAGQHIEVGNITVTNDKINLYVTFNTIAPWVMGKTHLYVGTLANMPAAKNGNPKIGNFPYQATHNSTTSFTYTIPLNTVGNCFIVAAHAETHKLGVGGAVVQSETAWGSGTQFNPKGSWAMYIDYCVKICTDKEI